MNKEKLYISWANLVDLGFEFALANLKAKYGSQRALEEIKSSLRRQNELHCQSLIKILKKLK